jgi:hypothetical protein
MEISNSVYRLSKFLDDPLYEGFGTVGEVGFPKTFPRVRKTRDWEVQRLASTWKPLEVVGHVQPFNDYPGVVGNPAFSRRGVDALRDFLEPNGELLPLKTTLGSYYAFNVTTVADVLNWEQSDIKWFTNQKPINALRIIRYEFFLEKLAGLSIFRIPEDPSGTYVTKAFAARSDDRGLKGLNFILVWPLPPNVQWQTLAKQMRGKQQLKGLPNG